MTKSKNANDARLKALLTLLGGSVLLASAQPAQAANGDEGRKAAFRQFRQQNAGLDRHTVRKMFQSERRNANGGGFSILPINTPNNNVLDDPTHGYIRCGTEPPKIERALAREIKNQSAQTSDQLHAVRLNNGVHLDLTSSARNITLGKNLFSGAESVEITAGGESKTITAGSQVSAAEYIAVKQVLAGSSQKLSIDKSGKAIGGEVDLDAITSQDDKMRASNLIVSRNVTTYGDFGKGSDFKLLGDLSNFGTVKAVSSDSNVRGGAIRADDITNHEGAAITSSVDLTLDASGNLTNHGSINSDGSLTLSAGQQLNNTGSVQANNHVTVAAPTVNNQGTISSNQGNVNIDGSVDCALNVYNVGGTLNALNGAINVRSTAYNGTFDTNVLGGDLLSKELNINSGQGLATIDVSALTGTVTQTGAAVHVSANTELLNIGDICLTGDPTYFNRGGDINIAGNILVGENLVLIASRDILSADNITIQAGDASRGYDITFIAGASFEATGGADQGTIGPIPPPNVNNGGVRLLGKSTKEGGKIQFGNNVTILAQSTDATGDDDGGQIEMFTFAGKAQFSGAVGLGGTTIRTGGKNNGSNGDIYVVGDLSGVSKVTDEVFAAIVTGVIDTTGGSGGGSVELVSARPVTSTPKSFVEYDAAGTRTSSTRLVAADTVNKDAAILISNQAGSEINIDEDFDIFAGDQIIVDGDVEVQEAINWEANAGIKIGLSTPAPIKASEINLFTLGDIGTVAKPLLVDTFVLDAHAAGSKSGNIFIEVGGTGNINLASVIAKTTIQVTGSNRTFASSDVISAPVITLSSQDIASFNQIDSHETTLIISNPSTALTNANTGDLSAQRLQIITGGDVGVDAISPFLLPVALEQLQIDAPAGEIFVEKLIPNDKKLLKITLLSTGLAADNISLRSSGSVTLSGTTDADVGDVNVIIQQGDLNIGDEDLSTDDVVSAINNINLQNLARLPGGTVGSDKKSDILFLRGSEVFTQAPVKTTTQGDITITLGSLATASTINPGPALILTTVGSGEIVGFGPPQVIATPKSGPPVNLSALNAKISISNGLAFGDIEMEHDVSITADPPVSASDIVVVRTVEPEVREGSRRNVGIVSNITTPATNPTASIDESTSQFNGFNNSVDLSNLNTIFTLRTSLGLSDQAAESGETADDSYILMAQPRSFGQEVAICTDRGLMISGTDSTNLQSGRQPKSIPFADSVRITSGASIFAPSKDMMVETPDGVVKIAADSVVLISVDANHLSVYDMHDSSGRRVMIEAGGHSIALSPGNHVCITGSHIRSFADVNPIEQVGHRNVLRQNLKNGKHAFRSEFSSLSLADAVAPVKSIFQSTDSEAQKITRSVMKTTAVLMHLGQSSAPFEVHAKPTSVALN